MTHQTISIQVILPVAIAIFAAIFTLLPLILNPGQLRKLVRVMSAILIAVLGLGALLFLLPENEGTSPTPTIALHSPTPHSETSQPETLTSTISATTSVPIEMPTNPPIPLPSPTNTVTEPRFPSETPTRVPSPTPQDYTSLDLAITQTLQGTPTFEAVVKGTSQAILTATAEYQATFDAIVSATMRAR